MTRALAPVAARAGRLVRLLGSDRDGEVLAACRALGRLLDAHRLDWHAVAAAGAQPQARPWQALARGCLARGAGRLKPAESDFLLSMTTWPSAPSEKQARWLDAIAAALGLREAV